MKVPLFILLAIITHSGWDIIATWHGPGWYAEIDKVPVMGVFATKRECSVNRFDQPSTCRYIRKEADFPKPLPPFKLNSAKK